MGIHGTCARMHACTCTNEQGRRGLPGLSKVSLSTHTTRSTHARTHARMHALPGPLEVLAVGPCYKVHVRTLAYACACMRMHVIKMSWPRLAGTATPLLIRFGTTL